MGHPNLPFDLHIDVHICVSTYTLHTGMHTYTRTHAHMQIHMNTHTHTQRDGESNLRMTHKRRKSDLGKYIPKLLDLVFLLHNPHRAH